MSLFALRHCRYYMSASHQEFSSTASLMLDGKEPPSTTSEVKLSFAGDVIGPLPKGHSQHEPYTPHDIEFSAALPYKAEMIDDEGRFFLLERLPEQQDADITKVQSSKSDFVHYLSKLITMGSSGPVKSFCYCHLHYLEACFNLHVLLNEVRELAAQKSIPHRDFYNVRKVDTHVHAASCMNQKHLLQFIKKQMKTQRNMVVTNKNGEQRTLKQCLMLMLKATQFPFVISLACLEARRDYHKLNMWVSERIKSHQFHLTVLCFDTFLQESFVVACINFLVKKDHDPRPNLTTENIVSILACLQPYTGSLTKYGHGKHKPYRPHDDDKGAVALPYKDR
ncbi:AMP deaminase 1-like isoform X1 [Dysidea avara]|uniref:AMP deaminase 1-like isoform X1 n=3 Tax=Dysidea avara TaxID=196820 RepID=UPI003319F115